MKTLTSKWPILAGVCLALVLMLGGCAKMKQAKNEKAIRARHAEAVAAICKGNYDGWLNVVSPELRKSDTKVKLVWAALRVAAGITQPNPDDFRVDSVVFNDTFNLATVHTSRQTKGEWKKEEKPTQWTRLNEVWYLTF